jgi:hypothetical protein
MGKIRKMSYLQDLKPKLNSTPNRFHVYYHVDSDGNIFYIGKGAYRRAYENKSRSKEWYEAVSKSGSYGVCFFAFNLVDEESRRLEKELITKAFELGFPLVNKTHGGQGVSVLRDPIKKQKSREEYGRKIYCYQNGKVYLNSVHVSEELPVTDCHVRYCCNKKSIQAKGYEFDYLDNVNPSEIGILRPFKKNSRQATPVICEQTGIIYRSKYHASKELDIDATYIDRNIKGSCKNINGYTFKLYIK